MIAKRSSGEIHGDGAEILPRILVVDGEPLVRWSLRVGLRHAGFDAVSTGTAEAALALVRDAPVPAVVLLDIGLWAVDTRELLAAIRHEAPGCRVLLLAVEGQDVSAFDAAEVIRKPFDLHRVAARVRAALPYSAHDAKLAV
jgi:two-component system, OmpR family, response regulator